MTKLEELRKLIEEYPEHIPVREAAGFLGIGEKSLTAAVEQGNYDWAIAWQNAPITYGAGIVPKRKQVRIITYPFASWFLGGHLEMVTGRA